MENKKNIKKTKSIKSGKKLAGRNKGGRSRLNKSKGRGKGEKESQKISKNNKTAVSRSTAVEINEGVPLEEEKKEVPENNVEDSVVEAPIKPEEVPGKTSEVIQAPDMKEDPTNIPEEAERGEDGSSPSQEAAESPKDISDLEEGEGENDEGGLSEKGAEHLVFTLGTEEYAIELTGIQEIIRPVDVTPIPRANKNIQGVISLRGTVIPLYDLRKRLGLGVGEEGRQTRFLVVKLEKGIIGLTADKVSGVVFIPENRVEPPPSTAGGSGAEHLRGVATLENRFLILLNLERSVVLG